jgi:hypothetical protein
MSGIAGIWALDGRPVFDGLPCDERPYIEEILRTRGVRGHLFPSLVAPLPQARCVRTMLSGAGWDGMTSWTAVART